MTGARGRCVSCHRASTRRPAACAASRGAIEGGWAARLDGYGGMEEPDGASHAGLLGVSTWTSTGLPRASRQPACEACCRTAPRPTSATPRERAPRRAGMSQGRAQMIHRINNKVRTLHTPSRHHRARPGDPDP